MSESSDVDEIKNAKLPGYEEFGLSRFDDNTIYFARRFYSKHKINASELQALMWLLENWQYDVNRVVRRQSPDFVVNYEIGVEVKSEENYNMTRNQIHAVSNLKAMYVLVSNKDTVEIVDGIRYVDFVPSEYLP